MRMKSVLLTSLIFLALLPAQAQQLDTLQYSGDIAKRINFVILGDGYRAEEGGKFHKDARQFLTALFAESPFREYAAYFNVFTVHVASNESGADHPGTATDVSEPVHPVVDVDNYFGSAFDYFRIHRLLVPAHTNRVYELLAEVFPLYDQVILLVNSPHYGGSGGGLSVASTDASATEVAIHELGHSFGLLKDEYWAGDFYAGEGINMTRETQPGQLRWKNWLNYEQVGIYQHCCGGSAQDWYKPHQGCKMEVLGRPFCAVCREGLIERIHQYVSPIDTFSPGSEIVFGHHAPLDFRLSLIEPQPNTLRREWLLNGQPLALDTDSVRVERTDLLEGENTLEAWVEDRSPNLRVDDHQNVHLYALSWTIENMLTGLEPNDGQVERVDLHIYPNPAADQMRLSLRAERARPLSVRLLTLTGQELIRLSRPAANEQELDLPLSGLPAASYLLEIELDGYRTFRRINKQ